MKIGMPRGLLYMRYRPFYETFFSELGAEIVPSPATNKQILDLGISCCVDEACLPVKIFHGHVAALRGTCDAIFIPRLMRVAPREYICPKFCGLTEMIANSIRDLPPLLGEPLSMDSRKTLLSWACQTASRLDCPRSSARIALVAAMHSQKSALGGINDRGFPLKVILLGHPYNLYDPYANRSLLDKLHDHGIGVVTEEHADPIESAKAVATLFKRPFWTFARTAYGAAVSLRRSGGIDGAVYVSSFACGIDSVVVEMVREAVGDLPLLLLKMDEQTGDAGLITRIEAFSDLLERRKTCGHHNPPFGQRVSGGEDLI